jgi:uncharacterized repeat protein (TIGR03803 family)
MLSQSSGRRLCGFKYRLPQSRTVQNSVGREYEMFAAHSILKRHRSSFALLLAVLVLLVSAPQRAKAQTEEVLYNFAGGVDGSRPNSTLTVDAQGDLYSTTSQGGAYGYGTVFELTLPGAERVLFSFKHGASAFPTGGVIADAKGNLYGVTAGAVKHGQRKLWVRHRVQNSSRRYGNCAL